MSFWSNKRYFGGRSGNSDQDGYGGGQQQYEATGGKKRASSRLKKSSKKDEDADGDYPNYTASHDDADDDNRYNRSGNYHSNTGNDYGGGGGAYSGGALGAPYYGGGGYSNSAPYGNGGYSSSNYPYGNGGGDGHVPYNAPAAFWAPQDGTRSPMIISTREVNMYGMPGSPYDSDNYNDQRRRGDGGGGFFGPAFHAVGHFFDRKLGFNDRD